MIEYLNLKNLINRIIDSEIEIEPAFIIELWKHGYYILSKYDDRYIDVINYAFNTKYRNIYLKMQNDINRNNNIRVQAFCKMHLISFVLYVEYDEEFKFNMLANWLLNIFDDYKNHQKSLEEELQNG